MLSTVAQAVGLVVEKEQLGIMSVFYAVMANPAGLANIGIYLANTLLLAAIGFLTWYQQQLTASGNPQMAMMNWFMPLFLTFICLKPSGGFSCTGVFRPFLVWSAARMSRKKQVEMQKKPLLFKTSQRKAANEQHSSLFLS